MSPAKSLSESMERSRGQSFGGEERQALTVVQSVVMPCWRCVRDLHITSTRGCQSIDNERTKKGKNVISVDSFIQPFDI